MGPILCGTDFSDHARAAQLVAGGLCARGGRELSLVHVVDPSLEALGAEARAQGVPVLRARLEAEARALDHLVKRPVQAELLHGRPDAVLREFARVRGASLVVVGSLGHGTEPLARLGGTSERLCSANEVPVLVVRDDDPFVAWAPGRPLRALLATDDSDASASAVRWVEGLRALGPVDVVVGRVYYPDDAQQHYGLSRRVSFTTPDPALEALIERDLARAVPRLAGQGEVSYRARLGVGRVADHLLELAEAERCELVVVGTHRRVGLARLWSVSAAALHLARMAVAVVPPDGLGTGAFTAPPQLKRVLVTTDFSPLGNSAVSWAWALTQPGGEITLAHVLTVDPLSGAWSDPPPLPAGEAPTRARLETEVAARLRALTPPFAEQRALVTRTEVLRGADPAQAICECAARLGVDAIVMASHGRSGVARAVLGSVADAVLRASHRPVFIVRG